MPVPQDINLYVDKNGLIATGYGQANSATATGVSTPGNATYGYALDDVSLALPGVLCVSDTQPALTYLTGDIPNRTLAASTTHKLMIPCPLWMIRTTTTITAPGGAAGATPVTAAHGILVKSLGLAYRVNTTTITSLATMAINSAPLVAAAALPTVTAMTTTLAGNTLTAAANVYLAVSTVTTPAWLTTADTMIWAVATIVIPGSSTVDILGATWRCALAIY